MQNLVSPSLNTTDYIWKALLSEFLGTFILVLIITLALSLNPANYPQTANDSLAGALAYGLSFMSLIYAFGTFSGGHFNPAISFGFAVSGRMNWLLMLGYWLAQVLGAIAAAGLTMYFVSGVPGTNGLYGASTGYLTLNNQGAAFLLEAFLTFILVLIMLLVTRNPFLALIGGVAIGLVLTFEFLAAGPLTGASTNPARSLGPAIFAPGQWGTYWIYVFGPLLGALVAGLVYKLFANDWSCCVKKDDCGKVLKDECGNPLKECKRPVLDKCGKPIKDCHGKVQTETYSYREPKLTHHQENIVTSIGHNLSAQGLSPQYLEREFKVAAQKEAMAAGGGQQMGGQQMGGQQMGGQQMMGQQQGGGLVEGLVRGAGAVVGGTVGAASGALTGTGQGLMEGAQQGFMGQGLMGGYQGGLMGQSGLASPLPQMPNTTF
jgi:aquaporin Z